MTTARYRNYRRALAWIDMLEAPSERPDAHDVLRHCAEDLLLTREPAGDDEDPIETAAGVLTPLVATGGCSRVLADTIMECLHESGPQPAPAADRRVSLQSTPL
jgi:hypothetical protein